MLRRVDLVLCQFTRRNIRADLIFNIASSKKKKKKTVMHIPQYGNYESQMPSWGLAQGYVGTPVIL